MTKLAEYVNRIWIAVDILRGSFKTSDYGRIILSFILLRRLNCIQEIEKAQGNKIFNQSVQVSTDRLLHKDRLITFEELRSHKPEYLSDAIIQMLSGFNISIQELIIDYFKLPELIRKLEKENLLCPLIEYIFHVDLHPNKISNDDMGYIYEQLVRYLGYSSSEEAVGEYYPPYDVMRLSAHLLFHNTQQIITRGTLPLKIYDPACGAGGMLTFAEKYLIELNPDLQIELFGQEGNAESYALYKAGLIMKGQDPERIFYGDSIVDDRLKDCQFEYMMCNPPFGRSWKRIERFVKSEYERQGLEGRFGAGLPRVSDSIFLFIQHMISKFKEDDTLSRIAVITNNSPLMTGSAGSGESQIRRWIIENDWLETIVSLPSALYYNTGIPTYLWIISNLKMPHRRGKIQLIDASNLYLPMRKGMGNKRKELTPEIIENISTIYGQFVEGEYCKILRNNEFGYRRITIERPLRLNFQAAEDRINVFKKNRSLAGSLKECKGPAIAALFKLNHESIYKSREEFLEVLTVALEKEGVELKRALVKIISQDLGERDESAEVSVDDEGNLEPDPNLRDFENVPLTETIVSYFEREVKPLFPDAWINEEKRDSQDGDIGIVGYSIDTKRAFNSLPINNDPSAVKIKSLVLPGQSNIFFSSSKQFFYRGTKSHSPGDISVNLDVSRINIDYLNHYLMSEEGQEWLQYHQHGHSVSYITKEALLGAKLVLPPLDYQEKIVALFDKKKKLQEEIENIGHEIWIDPEESERLIDRYHNINEKDDNDFVNHLPYPLAVLFNHATNELDDKTKCDVYLKFFECLGALVLGAIIGEMPIHERTVLQQGPRSPITMGYYCHKLRKILSNGYMPNFRAAAKFFVNDSFIEVMEKATSLRNESAHSGITTQKVINRRLRSISDLVDTFKPLTKDFFVEYKLFRAVYAKWIADTYEYTIQVFSGLASTPFNKAKIKVDRPLTDGELYWGAIGSEGLCQCYLASPLVKLSEIEEGLGIEDFYFFNSMETAAAEATYRCPYPSYKESAVLRPGLVIIYLRMMIPNSNCVNVAENPPNNANAKGFLERAAILTSVPAINVPYCSLLPICCPVGAKNLIPSSRYFTNRS